MERTELTSEIYDIETTVQHLHQQPKISGTKGITPVTKYITEPPRLILAPVLSNEDKEKYKQPMAGSHIRILTILPSFIKAKKLMKVHIKHGPDGSNNCP